MDDFLIVCLVFLTLTILVAVLLVYFRLRREPHDVYGAVLSEKLSQLNPIAQTVNDIRYDLAGLQSHVKVRQDLEIRTADSIRRLETVIAGTQSKGAAGENILEAIFARLPAEWQVRDFRVGNKTVEFGLRLPNNLVLPIDSKWTATSLVEQFAACEDTSEQQRLKRRIETEIRNKAREVKKYIDPDFTASFGVAAVPDAVYELCGGIHADVFKLNVVVVSYGMFVPYLLLVFHTTLKNSQSVDLQRMDAYLQTVEKEIEALQGELNGRFSKAMVMLSNSRDEMSSRFGKVTAGLTSLRLGTQNPDEGEEQKKLPY